MGVYIYIVFSEKNLDGDIGYALEQPMVTLAFFISIL
jgi:hypothetical protein